MATIPFYTHSIDDFWRLQVESSETLTEEQKKKLIAEAHKKAVIENVKEIVFLILKILGILAFQFFLLYGGRELGWWK